MLIPPHDRARLANERAFQERVLAALEKPRRGRVLSLLNSPIFIWIMSLLVVTGGSFYYGSLKQCIAESKQLIRSYRDIRSEINLRQMSIGARLFSAHTLADVRSAASNVGFDNADFRDRRLDQLIIRLKTMPVTIASSSGALNPEKGFEDLMQSTAGMDRFQLLTFGQFSETFSPTDLRSIQAFGYAMYLDAALKWIADIPVLTTIDCRLANVVKISFGGEPQTVGMKRVSFLEFQEARDSTLHNR